MPRAAWGLAVLLAATGAIGSAIAQPTPLAPTGGPPSASRAERLGTPPPDPSESRPSPSRVNKLPPILGAPVRPASSPSEYSENVRVAGADRGELPASLEPAGSHRTSPGRPGEGDFDSPPRIQRVGALGCAPRLEGRCARPRN